MTPEQEMELKRLLDQAFQAFEAGEDERARELCRQALAIDPESSTAHSLMGLLYEREGRVGEAAGQFATILQRNPDSVADRDTLDRLRGTEALDDEFNLDPPERAFPDRLLLIAGAGLVVLALAILGGRALWHRFHQPDTVAVVASADVERDLEIARDAYAQARYETAMQAAGRVLQVVPEHDSAREIYERSRAYLQTAQAQPAVGGPTMPTAPNTQVTQAAPFSPPTAAVSTPAVTSQPAFPSAAAPAYTPPLPTASSNSFPRASTGGGGGVTLPPIPDFSVPGTPYRSASAAAGGGARVRPPVGLNNPSDYLDRTPPPPPANPPARERSESPYTAPLRAAQRGTREPPPNDNGGIRIEVTQAPAAPNQPAPAVRPGQTPATTQPPAEAAPADPVVQERQERRQAWERALERQRRSGNASRRAAEIQGQ